MAFTRVWDETVPTDSEHCGHGASRIRDFKEDLLERVHAFRPLGSVANWPSDTIPDGWLECDGSAISRTTYADLFALIGTRWGNGDGVLTFNIPDLRGYFTRGHNNGRTGDFSDPNCSSRVVVKSGKITSGSAVMTEINGTDGISATDAILSFETDGKITNGSPIITHVNCIDGLYVGLPISGTGIQAGSTILSIDSETQITISLDATEDATARTLHFYPTGADTHVNSVDSETQVTMHDVATISGTFNFAFIVGDDVGSMQDQEIESHSHFYDCSERSVVRSSQYFYETFYIAKPSNAVEEAYGFVGQDGKESRPCNKNLKKIIKASLA